MQRYIKIHPNDNVAVALAELAEGETVSVGELNVLLTQAVERGHKFALLPLAVGELVIKYGLPIGHATVPVSAR